VLDFLSASSSPHSFYVTALPWAEMLMRVVAGGALIPHGLRAVLGFFPGSGRVSSFADTMKMLDSRGFRPGAFWAYVLAFCQFIAGPLLALGFLTRPAALICLLFMLAIAFERARSGGYFWNKQGCEYPLLWSAMLLYFVVRGAGPLSVDALLFG
jgi:putative oxidoreductase